MRQFFRFVWFGCLVFAIMHPVLGKTISWPLEIMALSAVILIPFFLYQGWGRVGGAQANPANLAPVARPPRAPIGAMGIAALGFAGAALVSVAIFAFTGNAKIFIIFAILAAAAIASYYKGAGYLAQEWAAVWLILSLTWIVWTALDFQSWTAFILPVLSAVLALIVVLGSTGTVAKAIGQGILLIFREIGKVLTGGYGSWAAAWGYFALGVIGTVVFAPSNPDLARIFALLGGIATVAIFFIPGKKLSERMGAK
jgi:hypothetical protein